MRVFGSARTVKAARKPPNCPEWARRLFLEDVQPEEGDPGYEDWFHSYFLGLHTGVLSLPQLWAKHRGELMGEWLENQMRDCFDILRSLAGLTELLRCMPCPCLLNYQNCLWWYPGK